MSTNIQRYYTHVNDADVISTVYAKLWVYDATKFPWKHAQRARGICKIYSNSNKRASGRQPYGK